MSNKSVSIELDLRNLEWLQVQTLATGHRSLSETVNDIIAKARNGNAAEAREIQSIVGQVHISEDDPDLARADTAIRSLFAEVW